MSLAHPLHWMSLASGAWLALVTASPVAPLPLAAAAYAIGGTVCHQIAERSFHIAGAQLAVCARCSGIYAGAVAAFVWQVIRARSRVAAVRAGGDAISNARRWLVLGALPTAVTVALEIAGLWPASNVVRALAGVPLGAAVALVAGLGATLHYEQWRQRRRA